MRLTRRYKITLLLMLVVFIVVPVGLLVPGVRWWQRNPDANPLERWCANQIRRIADDLLGPKLDFSTLHLELPATATLNDVSLTSDGVAFITMTSMRLEFRQMPKRGQPLVIEAATFTDPAVRLIGRADGTLLGFGGFIKSTKGQRYKDGGSSRPSDFLAIKHVAIRAGTLEWAPPGHEHPMELDQLTMDLAANPGAARPGWYAFKAKIERPPVLELDWDGGISIDTGDLGLNATTLQIDLSEDEYASLAPSMQDVLRRYSIVGTLVSHATGHVPLTDPAATDLTFDVSLQDAGAAVGDYQFPVKSATAHATFQKMLLSCSSLSVDAFGGHIDMNGTLGFDDAGAFSVNANVQDVLLQDMLRPTAGGKAPRLSGKIGLTLDAAGERRDLTSTMHGSGALTIAEGRIIDIPAVGALADDLHVARHEGGRDRGEIDFTLAHDRATIGKADIQSKFLAVLATGDVYYDSRLDLTVNAGVIEKAESLLGALGDVLGALTDHLLPYVVTGTWSKPIVTPEPLGLPFRKSGDDAG